MDGQERGNDRGAPVLSGLFGTFEPEPVLPAGQGDDCSGRVVIVGGLPRGLSPVIERGRGTAHHLVQRFFLGKRKRVPARAHVDPQQVGQAGGMARALNALVCKRGQRGFSRSRVTLRRP